MGRFVKSAAPPGIALSHFCYRRRKTLAPQGPRKLPKLDVAGSTPVARSREFEELAPRRYEPPAGGGSLVALGPRGFSAEPAYLGEGSCHPLEQVCEGIRRAGSCTGGYIPQKQLEQLDSPSVPLAGGDVGSLAAHSATVTPPGQRDAMFVAKNPKSGSR